MPSSGKINDTRSGLTHNAGTTGLTATNNSRQTNMLQPGTCYARPICPQKILRSCNFYKVRFPLNVTASEVLPPHNRFLVSWCTKLGAPDWQKIVFGIDKISMGHDISISVPKIRDMDTIYRYTVSCNNA